MTDEDDKKFLQQIKDTGKSGTLGSVNMSSCRKDARAAARHAADLKRQKQEQERVQATTSVPPEHSSDSDQTISDDELDFILPAKRVKRESVLSPELCRVFDRVGCTDRGAVRILSESSQLKGYTASDISCRHHMRELILKAVFEEAFGASTGPDVSLFKYLRKVWPTIDQTKLSE